MIAANGPVAGLLAIITAHVLLSLFLFLLVEEAGVPLLLPGDTLIIAAAARPNQTPLDAILVVSVAALAAAVGSSVLFVLIRQGGRPLLNRFGRFLHLNEGRIARMDVLFQRYGPLAIVAGRLIPGLRTPTTIMAGLFAVPYRVFAPATCVAAALWAGLYYAFGAILTSHVRVVLAYSGSVGAAPVVATTGGIAAVIAIGLLIRRDRARKRPDAPDRA